MAGEREYQVAALLPSSALSSSENRYSETTILCRGFSDEGANGTNDRVGKTRDEEVICLIVVS